MEQDELFSLVVDILERLKITYLVVGSLASGAYGEPRFTHDIDVVVDINADQARTLCAAFPAPDFYVSEEAALDAITHKTQFNVLHPESGNKVDFMIAKPDAWGREQVLRRRRVQVLPGQEGFTGAREDIILSKMLYYAEAGSEKHLRDIAGILRVSGELVDRDYVQRWADDLGVADVWLRIRQRLGEAPQ